MDTTPPPFTIQKLPDEPIILATLSSAYRLADHAGLPTAAITTLLEEADAPCYLIFDLRDIKPPSVDQIIQVANRSSRGSESLLHHDKIKQAILVSTSKIVELAAKGLRHDVFGNVNILVLPTVDEALAYARSPDESD